MLDYIQVIFATTFFANVATSKAVGYAIKKLIPQLFIQLCKKVGEIPFEINVFTNDITNVKGVATSKTKMKI